MIGERRHDLPAFWCTPTVAGRGAMSVPADTVRIFSGTSPIEHLPSDSRGFAYGDGVFETMRAAAGTIHWCPAHWARLCQGARVLAIAMPDQAQVLSQIDALLGGADGVVKLTVSRGAATRGYAPTVSDPVWMLSRHALPPARRAIQARWCDTRLAIQPALAGIKHCNRLEQVLARAEWLRLADAGVEFDEGLMRSTDGDVVCATAGNLFALHDGGWRTPLIDRCGVRGVCRDWALGELSAQERRLTPADIDGADAVFVCNAVRGILQLVRLGGRSWLPHPQIDRLRARLALANPAFAQPLELP